MDTKDISVCLLLTRMPLPPIGGDRVKNYNLIQRLNKNYNLRIIVITDEVVTKEGLNFLVQNSSEYRILNVSKWRCRINTFQSLWNKRFPLQVSYYYSQSLQEKVSNFIQPSDIVFCCLIRLAEYSIHLPNKKILDIADSISINYKRSIDKVHSKFWKLIYKIEVGRVEKYEMECVKRYDENVFINMFECAEWNKFGRCNWIPNGVSNELLNTKYKQIEKYSKSIAFFGKMDYQPNKDAVKWFASKVLPLVDKNYTFLIVGANHEGLQKEMSHLKDRVFFTGYIENPYEILVSCTLVTAPMQTGGGMQNKILECMAIGQLIVTNSLGATPIIGAENKKHLFIEETATAMANTINEVILRKGDYTFVGQDAKRLIEERYTWDKYESRVTAMINALALK